MPTVLPIRKKKQTENKNIQSNSFSGHSSFGYTDVKTCAVFTLFRETKSDTPNSKVPCSSQILSHVLKSQSCLKTDESRPVEAGACHKGLMTGPLTNFPYRQNNHYQHHLCYIDVSCAPPRIFFPIKLFYPSFIKHQCNILPNFCGMQPR